jgi:hypothetical protein
LIFSERIETGLHGFSALQENEAHGIAWNAGDKSLGIRDLATERR